MRQTPVLPSNAPPLRNGVYYSTHAPRALQEQSANAQQSSYSYPSLELKYPVPVVNENAWVDTEINYPAFAQPLRHRADAPPYQRRTFRPDRPRDYIANVTFQERQELALAECLAKRMSKFPKYRTYREKVQKMALDDDKNVWPDQVHIAFLRGLIRYNPRGKKAVQYKNANMGRNELIADHILELTGVDRPRKKVSSHIQTLKKMFVGDPWILRFFQEDKDTSKSTSARQRSARHASQYPVSSPYARSGRRDFGTPSRLENDMEAFRPAEFEMFVQQKARNSETHEDCFEKRHCYTRTSAESAYEAIESATVTDWQKQFPLLAQMHRQQPLDCNVILGSASIEFPGESVFKDEMGATLSGIELGISLRCTSNLSSQSPAKVWYRNSFYHGKDRLADFSSDKPEPVLWAPNEDEEKCLATQLRFGSTFWANTLGMLANKLQSGDARQSLSNGAESEEQRYVRRYLEQISVLQEVMTQTTYGPKRLLIILWHKFFVASGKGSTSWNRLDFSGSSSSMQYPFGQLSLDSQCSGHTVVPEAAAQEDIQYGDGLYIPVESSRQHQPFLQSPFEYESSAESGTSATTWPSISSSHDIATSEPYSATTTNSFDFEGGNINMTYDSGLDFSGFDDAVFSFELPTGAGGTSSMAFQSQAPDSQQSHWNYGFDMGAATASRLSNNDTAHDTELQRALYEHAASYHPEAQHGHASFGAAESFPADSNDMEVDYGHVFAPDRGQDHKLSRHDDNFVHDEDNEEHTSQGDDHHNLSQYASPTHGSQSHHQSTPDSPHTIDVERVLSTYASPSTQYEHQAYAGAGGSHSFDQQTHEYSQFHHQQSQTQEHDYTTIHADDQKPTPDDNLSQLEREFSSTQEHQGTSALDALADASSYMAVASVQHDMNEYDKTRPGSAEVEEENQGLHDSNARCGEETFSRSFQQ